MCEERLSMSTPSFRTSNSRYPAACTASVCTTMVRSIALARSFTRLAISEIGSMVLSRYWRTSPSPGCGAVGDGAGLLDLGHESVFIDGKVGYLKPHILEILAGMKDGVVLLSWR